MDLQRNIAIYIHYHSSNSSYDAWKILVLCLYRLTWTAERHISGSSPPPRAIKFSMNCWNSLGSSVSKTGPTAENDHFYLALQTHIHFKWFSLVVVCPIPWQSLMFLLPFKKKKSVSVLTWIMERDEQEGARKPRFMIPRSCLNDGQGTETSSCDLFKHATCRVYDKHQGWRLFDTEESEKIYR